MAIRFSCRNCGKSYSYEDGQKGLQFSCRKCRMPLTVPDESQSAIPSPKENKSKKSKSKKKQSSKQSSISKKAQLAVLSKGIGFQLYSIVGELFGFLMVALAVLGSPSLALVGGVTLLVAAFAGIIGKYYCLSAPVTYRMGGLTGSSMILELAAIGLAILGTFTRFPEPLNSLPQFLAGGASLLFFFAVRRLARALQEKNCVELATSVTRLMWTGFWVIVIGVGVAFIFPPLIFAASAVCGIAFLLAFVRYVRLLGEMRTALGTRV